MRTLKLTSAPGFLIALICCLSAFVSCKNDGNKTADDKDGKDEDVEYVEYRRYVVARDSVKVTPTTNWDEIDREYNAKKAAAQKDMDKWNQERKDEYARLDSEYETWKANYLAQKAKWDKWGPVYTIVKIESIENPDLTLQGVTGENIETVYKEFVQTIKANKEGYSLDDWNEIEKLWEALEERKDLIKKDIKNTDLVKMGGWKTEYVATKGFKKDDKVK